MTMDPVLGDVGDCDVHIAGGRIMAVGPGLDAPGAEALDGRDMIVLPGLIDTHTHLWSTQMRGRFGAAPDQHYFRVRNTLAEGYQAQDMYHGALTGAAESIFSGVTTVVDFCHNIRNPAFAAANLCALVDSGVRGLFLFGAATNSTPDQAIDLEGLETLARSWTEVIGDAPLKLGLAWRGPLGVVSMDSIQAETPDLGVAREEFQVARRLGLPICLHVSGRHAKPVFNALVHGDFLGDDVQLVHFTDATTEDIEIAAEANASVSLTPLTELRVGYGVTRLGDYTAGRLRVGLGVDSNALAGASNMFSLMKLFQLLEAGRLQDEGATSARKLVELATIEGARSIGMAHEIGSITPGKRADVIMVATNALNMASLPDDPANLIVSSAQPANVDTVIVDGRVLKRSGRMTAVDPARVIAGARRSIAEIVQRVRPTE